MEKLLEFWDMILVKINDYVLYPLSNMEFIDYVDILLLALLLYVVYRFIRDRHVGRIALGLGAVVLVYILGDLLHMTAISAILKSFYVVGIVVVCIIFQPELRAALEEVGSTSLQFKKLKNKNTHHKDEILNMVDEVSAAAFELSARGDGALIVIERRSRLRSQMTEGVELNANVSRQLLSNIFFNKSPLHDGAVIIHGNKIVAASSKSKNISESDDPQMHRLGTRHRAALRISEVSDAVVVIVSEETGIISIANNKILQRGYQDIGKDGTHKSYDLRDDLYKLITGNDVNDNVYPAASVQSSSEEQINVDDNIIIEDTEKGGDGSI